jgi:hypothetical protein
MASRTEFLTVLLHVETSYRLPTTRFEASREILNEDASDI